jgi:hypothetical protein
VALAVPAALAAAPEADSGMLQRLRDTASTRGWAWRGASSGDRAEFHGVVSYDAAGGGAGSMMYPVPAGAAGPVGLLVGILTHAAINSGARSAEAKRIEEEADKVLLPLRDRLDRLLLRDIEQLALPRLESRQAWRLLAAGERADDAWIIETQPVFLLTQDRRAMVLESFVRVFDGGAKTPTIERAVRVVSAPIQGAEVDAYWRAAEVDRLAQTGAALVAEAIRTAMLDAQAGGELTQRTVRYAEGAADRFERAMVLTDQCGRTTLRTLRGGVMSVPAKARGASVSGDAAAAPQDCGAPWPDVVAPTAPTTAGDQAPVAAAGDAASTAPSSAAATPTAPQ